jgi:hypothetical protein
MKANIVLLIAAIGLSACTPDQGDFKYIGSTPEIKATILSYKIESAASQHAAPILRISGVVQERMPFPVKHYYLTIRYDAAFAGLKKKFSGAAQVQVVDGKGSFEDSIYLGDMPTDTIDQPITFSFIEASWAPRTHAHVELEVQNK